MSNLALARDFCAAFDRRDLDGITAAVTADVVYHNIPMDVVTGRDGVRTALAGFVTGAEQVEFVIHTIAEAANGSVLTERTDRFLMGGKWIEVRVMGVFEFKNGLISAWRDYFDLAQFTSQMPAG